MATQEKVDIEKVDDAMDVDEVSDRFFFFLNF